MNKRGLYAIFTVCGLTMVTVGMFYANEKALATPYFWGGGFTHHTYKDLWYWESSSISNYGLSTLTATSRTRFKNVPMYYASFGYTKVSTSDSADLKYYAGEYVDDWYGLMTPYKIDDYDRLVEASTEETWDQAKVRFNVRRMNEDSFNTNNKQWTVLHEVGHVYAMEHRFEQDSVMRYPELNWYGGTVFWEYTDLTKLDKDSLKSHYYDMK